MKWVVINPNSNAQRAQIRWEKIKSEISYDQVIELTSLPNLLSKIQTGDQILAAGGDGCLHSVVNQVVEKKGLPFLKELSFGFIGLGSNNSFLQPVTHKQKIKKVPVQIQEPSHPRDLIEIKINDGKNKITRYAISNASLGLLAYANITFNQNSRVQRYKKWSVSLADIASFAITLKNFTSVKTKISGEAFAATNLHWLMAPYFTKDLHFPVQAPSGSLDFYALMELSKFDILSRFLSMMVSRDMSQGYSHHQIVKSQKIQSEGIIPIELDGEIYFGQEFEISVQPQAVRFLI